MSDETVPPSDKLRTAADWYDTAEFRTLLLEHVRKAVKAAIASHTADEVDVPLVVDESG